MICIYLESQNDPQFVMKRIYMYIIIFISFMSEGIGKYAEFIWIIATNWVERKENTEK